MPPTFDWQLISAAHLSTTPRGDQTADDETVNSPVAHAGRMPVQMALPNKPLSREGTGHSPTELHWNQSDQNVQSIYWCVRRTNARLTTWLYICTQTERFTT